MKPIILCIDRDNDFGRKTKFSGPIVGLKDNLEAAKQLALSDPSDTDVNALYGAIKTAKELKTDIVTLTGDEKTGLISDREIARQLDEIMKKLKPGSVIFVSDGLDDEQVLPIVQSRVKIDSVNRIVVRQSKELEKAYFKMANFIKEVLADPELARLLFGLPGLILVLLAIGGVQALNLIMALTGVYLIIKGVGWEEQIFNQTEDFLKSLSVERVSTLLYFMALILFGLGAASAFDGIRTSGFSFADSETSLHTIGLFILSNSSINFVSAAIGVVIAARIMDDWKLKLFIQVKKYLILAGFIAVVKVLLESMAKYMVNDDFGVTNFGLSAVISLICLALWIRLTEFFFKPELEVIYKIMADTEGKEVYTEAKERIGTVRKAVVEYLDLKEIHTKRAVFKKSDILEIGDTIVVAEK